MKKLSCQIKLFYLKVLYAFLEVLTEIPYVYPYFVRQKIYIGAAIIAITVTINSCSSSDNRKTIKDDKKINPQEITTTCYDSIAPLKKVEDSGKNQTQAKKQKPRFVPPVIKIDSVEMLCYDVALPEDEPSKLSAKDDTLFFAEQMPSFTGGIDSMQKFIYRNLNYPKGMVGLDMISGNVYLQFTITSKGNIENIKVLRSLHPAFDNEAIRVVKLMPRWIPGKQDGIERNVRYTLPVRFNFE